MSQAMTKRNTAMTSLRSMLEQAAPKIQQVLPKHLTAERMVRITTAAVSRTPELLECTPLSIVQSVMVAARLGLECDGILGSAYLVPYRNKKTGQREAQLIPGYRGLVDLARRSGSVVNVWAHPVHENDTFEAEFGMEPKLRHVPTMGEPGRKIAVYACARLADGSTQFELMTASQVESIKARSRASSGPWVTDEDEMWRKTAVRRLCKYLPLSVEMAAAMTLQAGAESGETSIGQASQMLEVSIDSDESEGAETVERPSKADRLASQIRASPGAQEEPPPPEEFAGPEAAESNGSAELSQSVKYALRGLKRIRTEDGLKAWTEKHGSVYGKSSEAEQEALNEALNETQNRINHEQGAVNE